MNETFNNMMDKETLEKYNELKCKAIMFMAKGKVYNAEVPLKQAYELFKQDAEVCSMMGACFYAESNLDESLKFYKYAYELDNKMTDNYFMIGRILLEKQKYAEAVYYFREYLSEADKSSEIEYRADALRHLGYCYYYMDDFMNAEYYFKESYKIDSKNKYTNIFLKNTRKSLESKKSNRYEKYEDFHGLYNNLNSNDTYVKRNNKSSGSGKAVKTIISVILSVISIVTFVDSKLLNSKDKNDTNVYDSTAPSNTNSSDHFIDSVNDYISMPYNMPVSMKLEDIKSTDYYELSEVFNERIIYSKEDIDKNDWWNNVECRIYTGNFDGDRVIFSIPMDECEKADKKEKYNLSGAKHEIDRQIYDDIVENTVGTKKYAWVYGGYITSQKNMVDEAENLKKTSYINDEGKTVKSINSAEEYKNNNYSDLQSVYLTEIMPLDYYVYHSSEHNTSLVTGAEMKKEGINPDLCMQMYAGKLDDLEIGFVDPEFSMSEIDDMGGYRVEGRRLCMGRNSVQVNVEGGYGGKSSVDIYWWFMEADYNKS